MDAMQPPGAETPTGVFLGHREFLFGIAYGMLGTVTDAEDVLQEVWLSWAGADHARVRHPRAYLARVTVNQALAHRSEVARRRESYVGQWLPEPVADAGRPADAAEATLRVETLSMALLVVLESLGPTERAVFVLHDVFGYPHREIAEMIGATHAAVRQTARRARGHVHARRPRHRVDRATQQRVTDRFVDAALGGDIEGLLELLAPDVTLRTDGGGVGPAESPWQPVRGAEAVADLLLRVSVGAPGRFTVERRSVNSQQACVLTEGGGTPVAVLVLDLAADGRVREIYSVTNPDKFGGIGAGWPTRSR